MGEIKKVMLFFFRYDRNNDSIFKTEKRSKITKFCLGAVF